MVPEDPRLHFVLIEIDLAITFAQISLTAYGSGHDEHGNSAKANAIKAMESARHFMKYLGAYGQQLALAELSRLEEALKVLD